MLKGKIEAVLFVAGKPVAIKTLAKLVAAKPEEVATQLRQIKSERNADHSGIHLLEVDGVYQLISNPAMAEMLGGLVRDEYSGELTRPQLETLSIVAYRAPVTKPEIEQIRGVNCSLILRNLLIRGLIEEKEDGSKFMSVYTVTADFLRHLGLSSLADLPEFERFHADERIAKLIEESSAPPTPSSSPSGRWSEDV